jgi:hypothetical protein
MLMGKNPEPTKQRSRKEPSSLVLYASYAGVLVILAGSIAVVWDKGANYLIANQQASFLYLTEEVPADEEIKRLERIVKLAPDVPRYWNDLAEIEHGRAAGTDNAVNKTEALSKAYEYHLKGFEANPMEVDSIYKLAFSAWEAENAGRPELRQEALRLYRTHNCNNSIRNSRSGTPQNTDRCSCPIKQISSITRANS